MINAVSWRLSQGYYHDIHFPIIIGALQILVLIASHFQIKSLEKRQQNNSEPDN